MRDTTRLRAAPFLWGALALAALFVVIYLFFVRTYAGQIVDERAFIGANSAHDAFVALARHFLDVLPVAALGAGLVTVVIIGLVRRNWRVLIVAAIAVAGANASTELLKYTFLSRPETGATFLLSNSFPSGHTTVAASVALAIFLVSSPRYRAVVAVCGAIFAIATGAFTLVSQWHRPSDVIAGFLVVAFWGCVAGCILAWSHDPPAAHPVQSRLAFLWWIAAACGLVAFASFLISYLTVAEHGSHLQVAYLGGISAITAVGFALAATANRMFRVLR
jgi:membrane-associated phospholipid phosphatase